ncbi:zinc finger, CCHC-type containing protein [Tanacetum coccineum]
MEDGSVLYIGDDHFAPVHGKGSVVLEYSSRKSITLFNVLYVPKLRKNLISGPVLNKCGYKQVYESDKYILSKCGVFVVFGYYNNGMFMLNLNKVSDDSDSLYMSSSSTVVNFSLWHARLGHVHYKRMLEISKDDLIPAIDEDHDKCNKTVPNKRNKTTPYELWFKKRPNLAFLRVWGCRAVVRLPDPKQKTLGEKGIDCIFVGYAEHSKAYRFYVIEPNDSVSINSIIESRDAIFDENRFSSIPRPKDIIPNLDESQRDDLSDDVPSEIPKPRKGKRVWKAKSYGSNFQLYLVEGSRDQVGSQYSYCYSIEEDPRTYNEAMRSRDSGCKWIFKRKMKVDGTIDKFKARLVIQGFRQKEGIDYFDTYAPVVRITTIRLLLALAAIHNLVIHQMDVKTSFLNGDLLKEVYMKQPEGFVMPGNKHKGIVITQSYYIEKILKKFNHEDCSPVSTPMDLVEKLKPNTGKPVDQLKYSRAIRCLMYAMTSTRPDIGYAVGRLSRFTSNPSRQHWQAITRVFKYLKGTMNYGLSYMGYPSVLEGYSDCSWINHVENSSSMSGWVFLLGGGTISWASKKQICITGSTMESEFVALAAAGKEAEWLRNLIHEIPIWPKPIAPVSIQCDSAPTMAKAYSQIYNGKSRHLGVRD